MAKPQASPLIRETPMQLKAMGVCNSCCRVQKGKGKGRLVIVAILRPATHIISVVSLKDMMGAGNDVQAADGIYSCSTPNSCTAQLFSCSLPVLHLCSLMCIKCITKGFASHNVLC